MEIAMRINAVDEDGTIKIVSRMVVSDPTHTPSMVTMFENHVRKEEWNKMGMMQVRMSMLNNLEHFQRITLDVIQNLAKETEDD